MTSSKKTSTRFLACHKARYRLAAYVRLSPSDEIREEGSLVSHPQRIKSFVDFKNSQETGWGEVIEIYTDKDYSGKDTNRPAFRRMLQDIKQGHVNAVIVTELSRISRDVKDFCNFWEFMKLHKGTFISLKENFDTTTPIGEMMVIQAISFAQFERKTIVTRIKEGARARAERGLCTGGQRILGYDPHPTKKGQLAVNDQEAATVRHIFEKFIELGSLPKLQNYLNESGFRTKQYLTKDGKQIGGHLWSLSSLFHLMSNKKLIGKVDVNLANKDLPQENLPPLERYKVVDASWPAIVGVELFNQVQEKLDNNRRFSKVHKHLYRLSGILQCGICGKELAGQAANGRGGKYFYYGHSRKFSVTGKSDHQERCKLERMPAVRIEEAIIGRLIELTKNKKLLTQIAKDSESGEVDRSQELDHLLATKEQERRNLDRQIDNLLSTIAELPSGVNPKTILNKVADLEKQRDQVAETMTLLRKERRSATGRVINMEHVFRIFRAFERGFAERPVHEQRELIKDVVKRVTVTQDGLLVHYYSGPKEEITLGSQPSELEQKLLGEEKTTPSDIETNPTDLWSGVRPAFKVVGPTGVEPVTSTMSR